MTKYIVINHDDNRRYLTRTTSLRDALKVYDNARAAGIRVELAQKSGRNQLQCVPQDVLAKARGN